MHFARVVGAQLGLMRAHVGSWGPVRGRLAGRRGQTLVEYALLLALLAIALLGAMFLFRDTVVTLYNFVADTFTNETAQ